jgi:hypothetical protein
MANLVKIQVREGPKVVYAYGSQHPFDKRKRFYDCFEKIPGGNAEWRACAFGLDSARAKLSELALRTSNEVFIVDLYEDKVIDRKNVAGV